MPLPVVNRDLHFRRIAVVEAVGAAVILVAPEVLRVIDERVVVKPVPVLHAVGVAPLPPEGRVLGAGGRSRGAPACQRAGQPENSSANHSAPP